MAGSMLDLKSEKKNEEISNLLRLFANSLKNTLKFNVTHKHTRTHIHLTAKANLLS